MAKNIFKGKDKFITINIGSIKLDETKNDGSCVFTRSNDIVEQLKFHLTKYGKQLLEEKLKQGNNE